MVTLPGHRTGNTREKVTRAILLAVVWRGLAVLLRISNLLPAAASEVAGTLGTHHQDFCISCLLLSRRTNMLTCSVFCSDFPKYTRVFVHCTQNELTYIDIYICYKPIMAY